MSTLLLAQTKQPISIGEAWTMQSTILDEERTLNVYLPNDYHPDTVDYDVIYLLDGSIGEDFQHISGMVQFFDMLFTMPPTIVVGISNVDRKRDFTFYSDNQEFIDYCPTCGKSEPFIQFLTREVVPFIEGKYPTTTNRTLIGQSLGGLLASEILLKHPGTFTHYFIISPSLWWDDESLLHMADELLAKQTPQEATVFIAVGTEGDVMENDAKALFQAVQFHQNLYKQIEFRFLKKENHATILHNAIYLALEWLYPSRY